MTTLLIATRNAHKVKEIQAILGGSFQYLTLNDFLSAPITVEDADSFTGNATKKSVTLANWISEIPDSKFSSANFFVLADDSGLEVEALNGAPGIYSARFAAGPENGNSSDAENNKKLLRLLENVPREKRSARFRCALALTPVIQTDLENQSPVCLANEAELCTEIFEGICEGKIAFAPSGHVGFGYDPLFVPDGFSESFAALNEAEKNRISHRAKALEKLRAHLRE
ncbi:MAG: non-canonical purine NTP pyrophosphatase [Verrucomicrobiota bacterium]|nr:non-canonical purine NTP pyrophosphatase [Verrucomicrobiota bacterium]